MSNFADEFAELEEFETAPEVSPKRRKRNLFLGFGALALVVTYLGGAYYLGDKVPASTTVSGVHVGGLTTEQALAKLDRELNTKVAQARTVEFSVSEDENSGNVELPGAKQVDPKAFSAKLDAKESLSSLVGFSLNPQKMWQHFFGNRELEAKISVDSAALEETFTELLAQDLQGPKAAELSYDKEANSFQVSDSNPGLALNAKDLTETITENWLSPETLNLPLSMTTPFPEKADLEEYAENTLQPLLNGLPIEVKNKQFTIPASAFAPSLTITANAEKKELQFDIPAEKLAEAANEAAKEVLTQGVDAKISVVDHARVQIAPSVDGEGVDAKQLHQDLFSGSALPEKLVAKISTQPAKFTTADAEKLGVKEKIISFSTPLYGNADRINNLTVGARISSGVLVKPGEEFDLAHLIETKTTESDLRYAGAMVNGKVGKALGGGLSQVSTNNFNAAYRSGMVDVAHKPHSMWIPEYPTVIESTVWTGGQIDMIWRNNTPYGVVVDMYLTSDRLVTELWSTKYWDVEVWIGEQRNIQPSTYVNDSSPDCVPVAPGARGFTADAGRIVKLNGKVVEDSSLTWTYKPTNGIRCVGSEPSE